MTEYYLIKVIKNYRNLKKGMYVCIHTNDPNRKKYQPSGFWGWIFGSGKPSQAEIAEALNNAYGKGTVDTNLSDLLPSDVISIKYKSHGDVIYEYDRDFDDMIKHKY